MKSLASYVGAALLGAVVLLAAPAAQAQVNVQIGTPAWGPQVPYGTQYYYIPEIDGYYDLYSQQYIVYQDGYWVPLPQLYGYDPYQFHPVIVDYRGAQPWSRISYYRQHYAYQPYHHYGPGRAGYYTGGYGYGPSYGRPRNTYYSNGHGYRGGYNDHDRDDRGGYRGGDHGGYHGGDRGNQQPQQGGGRGYNSGQGQGNHGDERDGRGRGNNGGGRGNPGGQEGGGTRGGHARG